MSTVQANEITYELHSLGWKAFQNLCATITADIWGQEIQTFADSRDGGRDGAFHGEWVSKDAESLSGSFAVQCKFTAQAGKLIKLSDLTDELGKARRLAEKGLSDNYILFSNSKLTGENEEKICEAFENIPGIKSAKCYGHEWITRTIQESSRLRMLVPRVYGLGDLSQILDERAYSQAQEILSSLGDDLGKFIITDAYRQSAKALVEHGFVLLLGEPMCGKSTIAAMLSMGALDEWGCSTVKVLDANDFVKHFNPHEQQLFWVDDAFGSTQFDLNRTVGWNQAFPHVNAAIRRGSKVIFTSRDYIYRSAKKGLKESMLPVIRESQVVIHVENLTREEREQILYNHIRLGRQPRSYKTKLKPFLPNVAHNEKFSPEIARRLGDPLFTKELEVSRNGLLNFVERPLNLLREIIRTVDSGCLAALALVFMRGGYLLSPLKTTEDEEKALARLDSSVGGALTGLESLNGSLLVNSVHQGNYSWRFKHPTIRDAFAAEIVSKQDLMDIYVKGAPLDKLFEEISCGDLNIEGVKVVVPHNLYDVVIGKIKSADIGEWSTYRSLRRFLSYRCDRIFLERFIAEFPDFICSLSVEGYIFLNPNLTIVTRLHNFGLLPEAERLKAVDSIRRLAVEVPDSSFLREDIRSLMTNEELSNILVSVEENLLPDLDYEVENWRGNYMGDCEPSEHFEQLRGALCDYSEEFKDNEVAYEQIDCAIGTIDWYIRELEDEHRRDFSGGGFSGRHRKIPSIDPGARSIDFGTRSIFEDVDS